MQLSHLDHIVLTVKDIVITQAFYTRVLGMTLERFGEGRTALRFGNQKINLHPCGHEFEPKASHPTSGSADLCFIVKGDLAPAMDHVKESGVDIVQGPVVRTGTTGPITSFYFRDPDENLIEIATYNT